MMIRKTLRLSALSAGALLVLITGMILTTKHQSNDSTPQNGESTVSSYTVKEFERVIGVFSGETDTPEKVHTLFVRVLPETDRAALEGGITVSSEEELSRLIEDLTG